MSGRTEEIGTREEIHVERIKKANIAMEGWTLEYVFI